MSAPDTPERFAAYLTRAAREDQASYLIRHRDCGGLVGYVNINNIVRGALRSGHLGYAAFASHAGRGLMTAGLAAVVSDAFASLGLHRLEANIQPDNAPSLSLVRRLGFRREGFSPRYLMIDGAVARPRALDRARGGWLLTASQTTYAERGTGDGDRARPRAADRFQGYPPEARRREADAVAEQHRQHVHQDLVDESPLQALAGHVSTEDFQVCRPQPLVPWRPLPRCHR